MLADSNPTKEDLKQCEGSCSFSRWQSSESQSLAADRERFRPRRSQQHEWVKRAPMSSAALRQAIAEATLAEVDGPRPIVLLETNYYTFLPGEPLQLRLTVDPNGFGAPVTMYLYRENRTTGERRYYNVAGGLLAAGVQSDLFGSRRSPVPVFVPTLNDFVLFGSASDTVDAELGRQRRARAAITVPAGQTGLYQWVVELRDAAGKRVLARSNAMYSYITEQRRRSAARSPRRTTWTANNRYVLNDFVGVAAPAVLTIEPGTVIYGGDGRATLFIQRGAKIIADGTARRPIIFTSPQRVGIRAQTGLGLAGAPRQRADQRHRRHGRSSRDCPASRAYTYGGTDPADSQRHRCATCAWSSAASRSPRTRRSTA